MELEKVKQYIDILDDRVKEVIIGRVGLDLKNEKTQREIAKELSILHSYVSRIEKQALMKMFHEFYRAEREKRKKCEEGKKLLTRSQQLTQGHLTVGIHINSVY